MIWVSSPSFARTRTAIGLGLNGPPISARKRRATGAMSADQGHSIAFALKAQTYGSINSAMVLSIRRWFYQFGDGSIKVAAKQQYIHDLNNIQRVPTRVTGQSLYVNGIGAGGFCICSAHNRGHDGPRSIALDPQSYIYAVAKFSRLHCPDASPRDTFGSGESGKNCLPHIVRRPAFWATDTRKLNLVRNTFASRLCGVVGASSAGGAVSHHVGAAGDAAINPRIRA
jgi:hypothetical protein